MATKKSKGGFIDFVSVVAAKDITLGRKLQKVLKDKKVTATKVEKFFQKTGYRGISLEDCEKIIKVKNKIIASKDLNEKPGPGAAYY